MQALLEVKNLTTQIETAEGPIKVVDDLSFIVKKGKTLGIVGESGSGKTLAALSLLRLQPEQAHVSGQVMFDGLDLLKINPFEIQKIRGGRISFVFQEPKTSLNPVFSCGDHIVEALRIHQPHLSRSDLKSRVIAMLNKVGMNDPEKSASDYPHQISGGMRQRVLLAMALIAGPEILIADEPTSSLDITIQSQILELLQELQLSEGLTLILISHDLGVMSEMCDDIAVMYAGKIVEIGEREQIFQHPAHPYTRGLLDSVLSLGDHSSTSFLPSIPGVAPTIAELPPGCRFQDRCSFAQSDCRGPFEPPLKSVSNQHAHACLHPIVSG